MSELLINGDVRRQWSVGGCVCRQILIDLDSWSDDTAWRGAVVRGSLGFAVPTSRISWSTVKSDSEVSESERVDGVRRSKMRRASVLGGDGVV